MDDDGRKEDVQRLRLELSDLLDHACGHITRVNGRVKQVTNLQNVLLMKRDIAKTMVEQTASDLHSHIDNLKKDMERQIDDILLKKCDRIGQFKLQLIHNIQNTAVRCKLVEDLLDCNVDEVVLQTAPRVKDGMRDFICVTPEDDITDLSNFQFVSGLERAVKALREVNNLGHMQDSALDIKAVKIASGAETSVLHCGQELDIKVSAETENKSGRARGLRVALHVPGGDEKLLSPSSVENGIHDYSVVINAPGMYSVDIRVYGSHIEESPLRFVAIERPPSPSLGEDANPMGAVAAENPPRPECTCRYNSDDNKEAGKRRGRMTINRQYLNAVTRHIRSNGIPVAPTRPPAQTKRGRGRQCTATDGETDPRRREAQEMPIRRHIRFDEDCEDSTDLGALGIYTRRTTSPGNVADCDMRLSECNARAVPTTPKKVLSDAGDVEFRQEKLPLNGGGDVIRHRLGVEAGDTSPEDDQLVPTASCVTGRAQQDFVKDASAPVPQNDAGCDPDRTSWHFDGSWRGHPEASIGPGRTGGKDAQTRVMGTYRPPTPLADPSDNAVTVAEPGWTSRSSPSSERFGGLDSATVNAGRAIGRDTGSPVLSRRTLPSTGQTAPSCQTSSGVLAADRPRVTAVARQQPMNPPRKGHHPKGDLALPPSARGMKDEVKWSAGECHSGLPMSMAHIQNEDWETEVMDEELIQSRGAQVTDSWSSNAVATRDATVVQGIVSPAVTPPELTVNNSSTVGRSTETSCTNLEDESPQERSHQSLSTPNPGSIEISGAQESWDTDEETSAMFCPDGQSTSVTEGMTEAIIEGLSDGGTVEHSSPSTACSATLDHLYAKKSATKDITPNGQEVGDALEDFREAATGACDKPSAESDKDAKNSDKDTTEYGHDTTGYEDDAAKLDTETPKCDKNVTVLDTDSTGCVKKTTECDKDTAACAQETSEGDTDTAACAQKTPEGDKDTAACAKKTPDKHNGDHATVNANESSPHAAEALDSTKLVDKETVDNLQYISDATSVKATDTAKTPDPPTLQSSMAPTDPLPPSKLQLNIEKNKGKDVRTAFVRKIGRMGYGRRELLRFPLGITVTDNKDIVICDSGNDLVKIFSWDGTHTLTLGDLNDSLFSCPSAVVANEKGELFVKDNLQIQAFDRTGKHLRAFGRHELKKPYGLALTADRRLVCLDHSRASPRVVVFSQEGEILTQLPYSPLCPTTRHRGMCRFLTVHRDRLYVVDLGRSEIFVTDLEGKFIRKFGGPGHERGSFREPSGITKDHHGNLLIADSKNNRIQLFTAEGQPLGVVGLAQEIIRPSDIHLTPDGYLLVTNYLAHCIKVFKILPPS